MSNVVVDKNKIDILANAIADKSGEPVTMTLDEMVSAVDGIQTGGGEPNLQAKTYTVNSAGTSTVTADNGYDGLSEVEVSVPSAVPWVGLANNEFVTESNVRKWHVRPLVEFSEGEQVGWMDTDTFGDYLTFTAVPSNTTITPTTSAQTIGGSRYMMEGAITVAAMPSGTAGTPTATKGTVSNHSVSVTPSVTNTTGYITGSTKTGTAVTVTASELASGNKQITSNGTNIDVVGYSTVSVAVPTGGGSLKVGTASKTLTAANASISFTDLLGDPTSFAVISRANLATGASPYKTASVVFDGTNIIGQYITNTNNAQMTYASTGWSKTYSNGTLTVTGTGSNFQANEYDLVYTYGGSSSDIGTAQVQVGSGATSITFTGLTEEPTYWSCIFTDNIGTSSGYSRAHAIVNDGTSIFGLEMSNQSSATSNWTATYNNGSLTISSQSTSAGGYFHQPGYYQLTYATGDIDIIVEPLSVTANGVYSEAGKAYSPVTVNVSGGGGSVQYDTKTATASNYPTSLEFTGMKGEPKAFVLRMNAQVSSSGNTTYYYIVDISAFGTTTHGNCFRIGGTRRVDNITSGYSWTYSGTTLTVTSSAASRSASPGAFYSGSYELLYAY